MSLFDENITRSHPFDGVQKMTPIDGLDHVFTTLTGEAITNIKYQYERSKTDKEGLIADIEYVMNIVQQFHPEVEIGIQIVHKIYQQSYRKDNNGHYQREYPDESPIFVMYGFGWIVKQKEDGNIQQEHDARRVRSRTRNTR